MTTVYFEELEDCDNGEKTVTVFGDEDTALAEAGADILTIMRDKWDFTDDEDRELAEAIQSDLQNGKYREAIQNFNDREADTNSPLYVTVYNKNLNSTAAKFKWIDFSEYYPEDEQDEDEEDDEDDSPYQASLPGATCRGPCGNPSADAYADKRDGTYVCYQCKLFGGIFGKP